MAGSAEKRYQALEVSRSGPLLRARACAKLTIPSLLPDEGDNDSADLPQPNQSLAARGVNNVASKLLLSLLPPGISCFRLKIDESVLEGLAEARTEVESDLSKIESIVTDDIDTGTDRTIVFEALKHLVVAGNVLVHMPDEGMRMFRMDQYVCRRSKTGKPLEVIVREKVKAAELSDELKRHVGISDDDRGADKDYDLYTVIKWNHAEKKVVHHQELNGKKVPGSDGTRPLDASEWLPLRWQAVPGRNWGRGLCEEHLGDLRSFEGLSQSIIMFAAVAAKIIFLTQPNSSTDPDELNEAESGDFCVGSKDDITVLSLEKFPDFRVAYETLQGIETRLSHVFLLRSGTTRDAERVTAEEIRAMAQELEDAHGGTYTVLASELLLPYVRRKIAKLESDGKLPTLPKDLVKPVIVTGFQALGRNHSINRLRAWLADLQLVDPELTTIHKHKVAKRLGIGHGVESLDELIKTEEEMAQEQQQQMTSELASKAAPQLASVAAKQATGQ